MNTMNTMNTYDYDEASECCEVCEMPRQFITKEERIELLKKYKIDLEKESQGVTEAIAELEKEI